MKTLNPNWFTEGILDAEYKRYILLAYLQEVEKEYKCSRIFPALQNLAINAKSMQDFKDQCESLSASFPKSLTGFDPKSGQLQYTASVNDPQLLAIINEIIDYSLPKIALKLQEGKEIYDTVENLIEIEPLGIIPIYKDEGYLFIQSDGETHMDIYTYKISFLEEGKSDRILETTFLKRTKRTISNTFYGIKEKLIKEFQNLPIPATYVITSHLSFPKEATLLPVAKRLFVRKLVTEFS